MKQAAGLAVALLAFAVYVPVLGGELVWDDAIVQARQMVAFRSLGDVFFPPQGLHQWSLDYYRPTVVLSYLLDQALFGRGAARGPHAMVALYHAMTSWFVWLLAWQLLRGNSDRARNLGALVAGAVFAVHPIHTESVCWITGRSDTMATLCLLPSASLALRWRDGGGVLACVGAALLYLMGVLGKEVGLALWLALPALLWLAPRPEGRTVGFWRAQRAAAPLHVAFAMATVAYFALRTGAQVRYGQALDLGPAELVARAVGAAAYYLQKGLVPTPQSHFVTDFPPAWASALGVVGWGGGLALCVLALRRGQGLPLLAWSWAAVSLAPSLAIAVRSISETPLAERYLYLPSVALAWLAGWAVARNAESARRGVVLALAVVVVALYGAATWQRGLVWRSNLELWGDAVRSSPSSSLPWLHLGMAQQEAGRHEESLVSFEQAVARASSPRKLALAHNNTGLSLSELGRVREAKESLDAAVRADPDYETAHFNLGMLSLRVEAARKERQGRRFPELLNEAHAALSRAVELDPGFVDAHYFLARCAEEFAAAEARSAARWWREAGEHAGKALELDPAGPRAEAARALQARARAFETP